MDGDDMNIDIEKLALDIYNMSGTPEKFTKKGITNLIESCEIKPIDCSECGNKNVNKDGFDDWSYCEECKHYTRTRDHFKPKRNELDSLFIGAPVMVKNRTDEDYELRVYYGVDDLNTLTYNPSKPQKRSKGQCKYDKEVYTWHNARLPTVNEAPRNVWLCPWLEMPAEIIDTNTMIRHKNNKVIHVDNMEYSDWDKVEAVMILGDFKYE